MSDRGPGLPGGPRAAERDCAVPLLRRIAELALAGVQREQPNVLPRARELTPAFYGCYDWHSAVHSHWALVRTSRLDAAFAEQLGVTRVLEAHLTSDKLQRELAFVSADQGFELPYGLAWLLRLDQELGAWAADLGNAAPAPTRWRRQLAPLVRLAAERSSRWFAELASPVETGQHGQSAFALGLCLDWARSVDEHVAIFESAAVRHHQSRRMTLQQEPDSWDFLSPSLAAADVLRRVLSSASLATWLDNAWPELSAGSCEIGPVSCPDDSDGKLAHRHGLNLSRAWMLLALARALPASDPRRTTLESCAEPHRRAGLDAVLRSNDYAVTHWLGSFALLLETHHLDSGAALP